MNPGDRLDAGRRAAAAGRYEEALREYVWFHDEALEFDQSFYGVRLSYALYDWVRLGELYPEARTTLVAVRDRKAEQLLRGAGSRELFHDVVSINEHLGEAERTHALFRRLTEMAPELAESCSDIALSVLVAAGDFDLAKRFLTDPDRRVRHLACSLNESVLDLQAHPAPDVPLESAIRTTIFDTEAELYADEVRHLLLVLSHTGRLPEATRLRADALELVADAAMREKVRLLLLEPG